MGIDASRDGSELPREAYPGIGFAVHHVGDLSQAKSFKNHFGIATVKAAS
jgi:hypothetical protein